MQGMPSPVKKIIHPIPCLCVLFPMEASGWYVPCGRVWGLTLLSPASSPLPDLLLHPLPPPCCPAAPPTHPDLPLPMRRHHSKNGTKLKTAFRNVARVLFPTISLHRWGRGGGR